MTARQETFIVIRTGPRWEAWLFRDLLEELGPTMDEYTAWSAKCKNGYNPKPPGPAEDLDTEWDEWGREAG